MKTTRTILSLLVGLGATLAILERDAHAGTYVTRSDTFCVDTMHPQVILENDVAELWWHPTGDLWLINTTGASYSVKKWGLHSPAALLDTSNAATLCYEDDGKLKIRDHDGNIVWKSSTQETFDNNRLALNRCSIKTRHDAGTTWSESTEECSRSQRDNGGGQGWCMARPTTANTQIVWDEAAHAELVWQPDGNLVLYATDGRGAQWASNTNGTGESLCFQADGNLVVYNATGGPVYSADTYGKGVKNLMIDACGVALADRDSRASSLPQKEFWRHGSQMCNATSVTQNWCRTTDTPSRVLVSDNAHLDWQADGNLVLYDMNGAAKWATNTDGSGKILCLKNDGKLAVYPNLDLTSPLWTSGATASTDYGAKLALDGFTLSISDTVNHATIWSKTPDGCPQGLGGGAFSYVHDQSFGNSRFGAEMWVVAAGADADSINNLRSKANSTPKLKHATDMYLPAGSVSSGFVEVLGDAGVSATAFSHSFTIVELSGYVGNATSQSNGATLAMLGRSAISGTVGVDFSPPEATYTFFEAEQNFALGPIPIVVTADVTGTIGVDAGLIPGSTGVGVNVTPHADLTASASAGVGISGASAGVRGQLTLVDVRVPIDLTLSFTDKTYSTSADLQISTLDGSIDLYAELLFAEWETNIASWDGFSHSVNLFTQSGQM